MNRIEFKQLLLNKGFHQYEVAGQIGISEFTLSRWLRNPTDEQEQKISDAINRLVHSSEPAAVEENIDAAQTLSHTDKELNLFEGLAQQQ